jgi:hypothetical protein
MRTRGFFLLGTLAVFAVLARGADATTPIDYTQRNGPFAPAGSYSAEKQTPTTNAAVQEKRVDTKTVEKKPAVVGERRAAIELKEAKEKQVREKDSHRPEKIDVPNSAFNHQQALISTGADTTKPPMVTKYQDKLVSASATNMARFPAIDGATGAKINRFVFRKNPEEKSVTTTAADSTPAAGGSVIQK